MRITKETDYALRIMMRLAAGYPSLTGAATVSSDIGVTQGFTTKILNKLVLSSLVRAKKGVGGGYSLAAPPSQITLRSIVETTEGSLNISHCTGHGEDCSRRGGECYLYHVFDEINESIADKLDNITLSDVLSHQKDSNKSAESEI